MNSSLKTQVYPAWVFAALTVGIVSVGAYFLHEKNAEIDRLNSEAKKTAIQTAWLSVRAARASESSMPVQITRIPNGIIVTNTSPAPLPVTVRVSGKPEKSWVIPKSEARLFRAAINSIMEIQSGDFEPILLRMIEMKQNPKLTASVRG